MELSNEEIQDRLQDVAQSLQRILTIKNLEDRIGDLRFLRNRLLAIEIKDTELYLEAGHLLKQIDEAEKEALEKLKKEAEVKKAKVKNKEMER